MESSIHTPALEALIEVLREAPIYAGAILLVVGGAYLFFGKWLFRVFIAGLGIAFGLEIGRFIGDYYDISGIWLPIVIGAIVGALAWPLWQVFVFLGAGLSLALILGEMVYSVEGMDRYYFFAAGLGLLGGGLIALFVMEIAAVGISAFIGAIMVLSSLVVLGREDSFLISLLLDSSWAASVLVLALVGLGVFVQLFLPSSQEAQKRRIHKAAERAKNDDEAEARRRYQRFLGR